MEPSQKLHKQLPFASLSKDLLNTILGNAISCRCSVDNFQQVEFDPLLIDSEKYNSDVDVNEFYIRIRSLNIPKCVCISSDNSVSLFSFLNNNVRPILRNLQYFLDDVYYNSSLQMDGIGLT